MDKRRVGILGIIILILSIQLGGMTTEAAGKQKRVLFISSYTYAFDSVQLQIQGINEGLSEDVIVDYEFMDTRRVGDDTAVELFYEGLRYRLEKGASYDVVILGDDAAFTFGLEHKDDLFEGVPLLFLGVNDVEGALEAAKDPLVTGVVEKSCVEKNIELGLRLNPGAKRVYVILDDTQTGQAERENYYACAELFPELEFKEINVSELTSTKLKMALRKVEKDSILIYITCARDAEGKEYSSKEAVKLFVENSQVPVMRMLQDGIGEGLLGGYVVSMEADGRRVAKMAMDIMEGKDPAAIEVVAEDSNIYMLDEAVMEKFEMDVSLIPNGTEIVNKTPSYFERNREVLIPACGLLAAMLIILIWFCIDNVRRRRLLQELEDAKGILESASQHDFLTGLSNRSKFMEDFQGLVAGKQPCTIMMIDIDDFKAINDTFGHTAGDEALQQLAERLKEMQSQILTPYRFAGDEFILILKSGQDKIVEKTAYQCRQIFSKAFTICGKKSKICGSIGIACYPKDAEDAEQLVIYADEAMYEVKKNGKNDFAFYQKSTNQA